MSMTPITSIHDLSKVIHSKRKELGLTQAEAAGLCGVGLRFWSELENGKESLHFGKVLMAVSRLGIALSAEH